ncbi:MAG TPA: kynureninase [Candidatus Sulfotelmatobacter sp.]|nr:kynureninase [Candidatus Sulfotelmatobacter sp.]
MSDFNFQSGEDFAIAMDARDPLRDFRERFLLPKSDDGRECLYLCGHSLGLQPRAAASYVEQELRDWAQLGVEAHFQGTHPWMPYHRLLTEQTAELVGAKPVEVVVMNSLTVNLHLMMVSFYRPTKARHKIVVERGAFPSDQYAVKSQIRFHGFDPESSLIELTPVPGESCLRDEHIQEVIEHSGDEIALIMLGGVNYATGQAFDMAGITRAGHARGCVVGFDLAHAAGNLVLELNEWGPDFAVWCSYKYLNGGPGCVAGCFVHERHARSWELPRFAGWWGHDEQSRFAMGPDFKAMAGAEGWQLSNPSIVSLAVLRSSMDIFHEAGMERLRAKSEMLTSYLEFLLNETLLNQRNSSDFSIVTPKEKARRGAQLSIRVPQNGRAFCERLTKRGVVGDWREPDTFRVAPVPLYNSYQDVFRFVGRFSGAFALGNR